MLDGVKEKKRKKKNKGIYIKNPYFNGYIRARMFFFCGVVRLTDVARVYVTNEI